MGKFAYLIFVICSSQERLVGQIRAGGICMGGGNCLNILKEVQQKTRERTKRFEAGPSWVTGRVNGRVCQHPSHPIFYGICPASKSSTSVNYD